MPRRYANPETWTMPEPCPYPQAIRNGKWGLTRGQLDFDLSGNLLNPFDSARQTRVVISHGLTALSELGFEARDCVRAVIFYHGGTSPDDLACTIARVFGDNPPTAVFVPLPGFPIAGVCVEGEFISSCAKPRVPVIEHQCRQPRAMAIRTGEVIFLGGHMATDSEGLVLFPGDMGTQLQYLHDRVEAALGQLGARLDCLVKLTTYFVEDAEQKAWRDLVCMRAKWFSARAPVITDIPLDKLFPAGAMVAIDGIAVCDSDEEGSRREAIDLTEVGKAPFDMPHPAAIKCGHMAFIGARSALSQYGGVVQPDVAEYQTRVCMEEIKELLHAAGFELNDVIKVNTYCVGRDGEMRHIMRNFPIRASYFSFPGPASTGVYVSRLPIQGQTISIDAIASRNE